MTSGCGAAEIRGALESGGKFSQQTARQRRVREQALAIGNLLPVDPDAVYADRVGGQPRCTTGQIKHAALRVAQVRVMAATVMTVAALSRDVRHRRATTTLTAVVLTTRARVARTTAASATTAAMLLHRVRTAISAVAATVLHHVLILPTVNRLSRSPPAKCLCRVMPRRNLPSFPSLHVTDHA